MESKKGPGEAVAGRGRGRGRARGGGTPPVPVVGKPVEVKVPEAVAKPTVTQEGKGKDAQTPQAPQEFPSLPTPTAAPTSQGRGRGRGRGQAGVVTQTSSLPVVQATAAQKTEPTVQLTKEKAVTQKTVKPVEHISPEKAGTPSPKAPPQITKPGITDIQQSVAKPASTGDGIAATAPTKKGDKVTELPAISSVSSVTDLPSKRSKSPASKADWIDIPKRSGEGSAGRRIIIDVNSFELRIKPQLVYHYDVEFMPCLPKRLLRNVVKLMNETEAVFKGIHMAFDGQKNIYTAIKIPFSGQYSCNITVFDEENERDKMFNVALVLVAQANLQEIMEYVKKGTTATIPQVSIQALDIAMRHRLGLQFLPVGRSLFSNEGRVIDLGGGYEMWYGHFQSLRLGWKPFLNIDVAHKAFPKAIPVIEMLCEATGLDNRKLGGPLESYQLQKFQNAIIGLKVEYKRLNQKRAYRVVDVTKQSADSIKFDKDGKQETVAHYFADTLQVRIRYPHLPCLQIGSKAKNIFVPLEVCSVKGGQAVMKRLDEKQTAAMIKQTATKPSLRKQKVLDLLRKCNFKQDPVCNQFGVSVCDKMMQLQARVLPSPSLAYGKNECEKEMPRDGVWNMRGHKFIVSSALKKWIVLNCSRVPQQKIKIFCENLIKTGSQFGMEIANPLRTDTCQGVPDLNKVLQRCRDEQVQMVLVVLDERGTIYSSVKQISELQVGVLTQCVKSANVDKCRPDMVSNLLLKINSKLGGTNTHLHREERPSIFLQPIVVFGADVTHPSPDQAATKPSVAAVCGSIDPRVAKYMTRVFMQDKGVEIIQNLQQIVQEMLMRFYRETRCKPQRILFFRDGVSEGQFHQVLQHEVSAIRKACTALHPDYHPLLTFLVVQKRHHTRFFPTSEKDTCGRSGNVPPGTILDHTITSPLELDFYLVSHQGIQGTSRPTKYHLLWDDNELSTDEIERITYYLCYTFVRCTRSVSYPAPTYYAHLAAYRGRMYIEKEMRDWKTLNPMINIKENLMQCAPMHFV